jgi:hypothetical protein
MTVKAVVEERSARAHSGHSERGRRGGGGLVRRVGAGAPFYRVGGGEGWLDGVGNRVACGGAPLWPSDSVGRGNKGGEWGVRHCFWERRGHRGSGTCARGGNGCVQLASSRGRRKPGGTHAAVTGEGGGGLGRPEAKALWGGRPAA